MLNTFDFTKQYEKQILKIINMLYKTFMIKKSFHIVRSWSREAKKSAYGPHTVQSLVEPLTF